MFTVANTRGEVGRYRSLTDAEGTAEWYAKETRLWHVVLDQEGRMVAEYDGTLWGVR